MPDWTKKNFDVLRDVSPQDVPIQWRFAREALRSPELGVSRFTYQPGARMPWGHRHREQEEAYVVVAGSGRAKLDDDIVELATWDVLRVAPAVPSATFRGDQRAIPRNRALIRSFTQMCCAAIRGRTHDEIHLLRAPRPRLPRRAGVPPIRTRRRGCAVPVVWA